MEQANATLPVGQHVLLEKEAWCQGTTGSWANFEALPSTAPSHQQGRSVELHVPNKAREGDCIKVAVQVLSAVTGSQVVMDTLDLKWTIKGLKELIAKRHGSKAPLPCQRLVFQGGMVKNDKDCVEYFAKHVGAGPLVTFQLVILPWSEALRAAIVSFAPDYLFALVTDLYDPFEPYANCSDLAAAHAELAKACFNNADAQLAGCGFIVIEFARMLDQTHRQLLIAEGNRDEDERVEQFTLKISAHLHYGFTALGYLLLELAREYLQDAGEPAWRGMQEMVTESLISIEGMATWFSPYHFVRLHRQLSSSSTLAEFCRTVEDFDF